MATIEDSQMQTPETAMTGEALAEHIQRAAAQAGQSRCWLLVDPTLHDPNGDPLWEPLHNEILVRTTPVRLQHREIDRSVWPRLVELDLTRSTDSQISRAAAAMAVNDWQISSLRAGRGHRIGGWLFGASNAGQLARHLSGCLLQALPKGGSALLRLQDPGALDRIWRLASSMQQAALLGPLTHWLHLDRWQQLAIYQVGANEQEATQLRFTPEQWAQLDQIGALNRACRQARSAGATLTAPLLDQAAHTTLRAASHGFRDERDWVAYADRALVIGPAFDLHPRMQRLLADRTADVGFARLIADLSDTDWQEIRAWCRQAMPGRVPMEALT